MIKTNELPAKTGFAPTDSFLVDMPSGTGRLSGDEAVNFMKNNIPAAIDSAAGLMSPSHVAALNSSAKVSENVTLYVAPDGDDTTGDGTENNPFASIQKAFNELGDVLVNCVIQLKAGTYNIPTNQRIEISSKSGNLEIVGAGQEQTIINATFDQLPSQENILFLIRKWRGTVTFSNLAVNVTDTCDMNMYLFYCSANVILYNIKIILNLTSGLGYTRACVLSLSSHGNVYICGDTKFGATNTNFGSFGCFALHYGRICLNGTNTIPTGVNGVHTGNRVNLGGLIVKAPNFNWGATAQEDRVDNGTIFTMR